MCIGGSSGKTADELYKEMRQEPEPLPSLSVSKKKRSDVRLMDVPKTISGGQRSSLLTALRSNY